jgi:hypothetical protein
LADLETDLQADRICTQSTEVGFDAEVGKGLDVGKSLPFTSMVTDIAQIP